MTEDDPKRKKKDVKKDQKKEEKKDENTTRLNKKATLLFHFVLVFRQ